MHPYRGGGGPVHSVRGFAPSIVETAEKFSVSVRSEDFCYNRASGEVPSYHVSVRGNTVRPDFSRRCFQDVAENVHFDEPGVYRFLVESADGKVRGECNPVWVKRAPT
jgi:hypothetical protein